MLTEVAEGKKYKTTWRHEREFEDVEAMLKAGVDAKTLKALELSRGRTVCIIELVGEPMKAEGVTYCSKKDTYSYLEGRKRSLKKALAAGGFSKADRTKFWKDFHGDKFRKDQKVSVGKVMEFLASQGVEMSVDDFLAQCRGAA